MTTITTRGDEGAVRAEQEDSGNHGPATAARSGEQCGAHGEEVAQGQRERKLSAEHDTPHVPRESDEAAAVLGRRVRARTIIALVGDCHRGEGDKWCSRSPAVLR